MLEELGFEQEELFVEEEIENEKEFLSLVEKFTPEDLAWFYQNLIAGNEQPYHENPKIASRLDRVKNVLENIYDYNFENGFDSKCIDFYGGDMPFNEIDMDDDLMNKYLAEIRLRVNTIIAYKFSCVIKR